MAIAAEALAGAALALAGTGWAAWAAACLVQAGNGLAPAAVPRRLVDHGPYRFGRHPMYLGLGLALIGLSLALGHALPGAAALVLGSIVHAVWIPQEEARLRAAFGGWYSDYMSDVRPWV